MTISRRIGKAQIPLLLGIQFLVGFVFWYGIEKVFLAHTLGLGPSFVSIIVIIYALVVLFLDVPASVIADRWGRKRILAVATICFMFSDIILGAATAPWMYIAGTILWGFYTASYSGVYEALLFDSLKEQGREKRFQRLDAWARMLFMVGIALSSIAAGGLAAELSLRASYFLSIIPLFIVLILLIGVREPHVHSEEEQEKVAMEKSYFHHLMAALATVWRRPVLRLLAVGFIGLAFIQSPLYEFEQYIFIQLFHSSVAVGILNGLGGFVLALGFFLAVMKRFPPRLLLAVAGVSVIALALFMNNVSLLFLAIALMGGSLLENSLQTKLQHATTSRTRASITSAVQFAADITLIPLVIVFGQLAEHQSIWTMYLVVGIIITVVAALYAILAGLPQFSAEHEI